MIFISRHLTMLLLLLVVLNAEGCRVGDMSSDASLGGGTVTNDVVYLNDIEHYEITGPVGLRWNVTSDGSAMIVDPASDDRIEFSDSLRCRCSILNADSDLDVCASSMGYEPVPGMGAANSGALVKIYSLSERGPSRRREVAFACNFMTGLVYQMFNGSSILESSLIDVAFSFSGVPMNATIHLGPEFDLGH